MIELNGNEVRFGQFPNLELNLPTEELHPHTVNMVKWVYEDDTDFLRLALVKGYIDDMGGTAELYITYMPHSRMDRDNAHYATAIKGAARLINSLMFSTVIVREPHSMETVGLLNNAEADMWCAERIKLVYKAGNFDSIYFPDYGAQVRYADVMPEVPKAVGKKVRDFKTGKITGLTTTGHVGKNVLIVDDLCSRGGTFVLGATALKEKGAERVCLLVAYVEDTVFTGELFDHIDILYTSAERYLDVNPRIIKLN